LGAGLAFADKYFKRDAVTLCYMGDGAVRQGSLHESFNLAMLWQLPVVFVCENNGYAMGTSVARTSHSTEIWKLGLGYEMPCGPVDGMDPTMNVHTQYQYGCIDVAEGRTWSVAGTIHDRLASVSS
jgi:pyruvate dehydrogenase E1 component alpha subunit